TIRNRQSKSARGKGGGVSPARSHARPQRISPSHSTTHEIWRLVVVIALLALTSAATVGLAFAVGVRGTQAAWVSADLDHQLAVDSLVAVLPELMASTKRTDLHKSGRSEQAVELTVGACQVHCLIRRSRPSLFLNARGLGDETEIRGRLSSIARERGWSADNIALRPIAEAPGENALPLYLWFDQLNKPQEPGEIFPLEDELNPGDGDASRESWSDVISFWEENERTVRLHVQTRCGSGRHKWFLVADVSNESVEIRYRTRV
ncbi:MAG: hypothetical protein J5J06_04030, partial [Phycisphaerae bacterium]|nr:hypothetical protein [Phycisphaerae bacterium]